MPDERATVEIRTEEPDDARGIREVHRQAFHPSPIEARLVDLLRVRRKLPQSWVAIARGRVVGHVAFSPITIVQNDAGVTDRARISGLGLAPVGVLPEFQRQGVGRRLIERGLENATRSGCDLVVVLGDPRYYTRFGFEDARRHQLDNEYHAEAEFMVLELRPGTLRGTQGLVKYQPEFSEAGC